MSFSTSLQSPFFDLFNAPMSDVQELAEEYLEQQKSILQQQKNQQKYGARR
ncbi:MAG: hypothetical protein ACI4M9_07750 [Succinivibrio sp.]